MAENQWVTGVITLIRCLVRLFVVFERDYVVGHFLSFDQNRGKIFLDQERNLENMEESEHVKELEVFNKSSGYLVSLTICHVSCAV